MDAGVASGFSHLAARENIRITLFLFSSRAANEKPAAASGCGGAGPSAALPLLPDASSIALVAAPCIRPRGARHSPTEGKPPAVENAGHSRRLPASHPFSAAC
jgi:hypothetical protein